MPIHTVALFCLVLSSAVAQATAGKSYLDVNLTQDRYLGEVYDSAQVSNYTMLSGDLNFESKSSHFTYKLNPVAKGAAEVKDEFYFGVPEVFLQPRKIAPGFSLTVGRQRRKWSALDEEFNLGVWQPQLRWDYLAPRQQGLVGLFFDLNLGSDFHLAFFTSPVFLPDQGPNYQLRDGQFTSSNRWFMPPSTRLNLFGGKGAPVYYQLDRPSEESIIMHSSIGMAFSYHPEKDFWLHFNYIYKPQNQIHLAVDPSNSLVIGGPRTPVEVNAVIHPSVVNHNVFTLESGFTGSDSDGYVSVTADVPNSSGQPAQFYESPLNTSLIAGGAFQHYVFTWLGVPSWLKYSYLRVLDLNQGSKAGAVAADPVESSLDRYPYREVAAVEWRMLLQQKQKNHLHLKNRYSYSVPEQGGWLSSSLAWTVSAVTWTLGLDILGSDVTADSPRAGLFTRYRNNDRVFAGVSYVF